MPNCIPMNFGVEHSFLKRPDVQTAGPPRIRGLLATSPYSLVELVGDAAAHAPSYGTAARMTAPHMSEAKTPFLNSGSLAPPKRVLVEIKLEPILKANSLSRFGHSVKQTRPNALSS